MNSRLFATGRIYLKKSCLFFRTVTQESLNGGCQKPLSEGDVRRKNDDNRRQSWTSPLSVPIETFPS